MVLYSDYGNILKYPIQIVTLENKVVYKPLIPR